ncbi:MAG: polysaccharide deacetylase family protein [Bacteroidota bacterium]|nr:polysaccharide deacetylase family protein [Bacteroidota bacterium]
MKQILLIAGALWLTIALTSCNNATSKQDKPSASTQQTQQKGNDTGKPSPNSVAQIMDKPEIPVLCYHRITEGKKGDYTVSPTTFAAHIKILADSGYHAISPAQLYDYLVYNKSLPTKPVMITFDDSREEHSAIAAPTLEKYGFRGVFFIMTITYDKKNYMTKEQIAQLAKAGHTVGLHTWDHTMVTKYKTDEDWQKEIAQPKEKLEKITGKPVEYIAYPNGVYNHESAEKMSKYMKLSFSLSTKRDTLLPLQCIRRIIVPDMPAKSLLKSMRKDFK